MVPIQPQQPSASRTRLPLERVRQIVIARLRARGRARTRVEAAARVALDFHTWHALKSLGDAAAADLAAGFVEHAAQT